MPGDWRQLRTTFEEVPELYDRARPAYPRQIFDDLLQLAELPEHARIVEIGCGTGRSTIPFAQRGYRITCVELGAQLAAVARRNLAAFSTVEIANADFETWQAAEAGFDAVVVASAFHWIDPGLRYVKSAELLGESGVLGVIGAKHVMPKDGDPFFVEVQEDYAEIVPDDNGPAPPSEAVKGYAAEIEASGLFGPVESRRYPWDVTYTADELIDLLETFSGHRALDTATREELYGRIRRRIEARESGTVTRASIATLDVARLR